MMATWTQSQNTMHTENTHKSSRNSPSHDALGPWVDILTRGSSCQETKDQEENGEHTHHDPNDDKHDLHNLQPESDNQ